MTEESKNSEDLRVQRTKHLLREAMEELLKQKDITDISIQQISRKAMIYRTTFYSHYADKYELLGDYLNEKWKKEIYSKFKIEEDQLRELYWEGVLETVKFYKKNSKLFIELSKQRPIFPEENIIYSTVKNGFLAWFDVIQQDNKKIKVQKERIADFYVSGYLSIILSWIKNDTKETCESITQDLIKLTEENLKFLLS